MRLWSTAVPRRRRRDFGPVLDPFMGSATIGVACLEMGLPYVGIEMDRTYYEIACERMSEAVERLKSGPKPS